MQRSPDAAASGDLFAKSKGTLRNRFKSVLFLLGLCEFIAQRDLPISGKLDLFEYSVAEEGTVHAGKLAAAKRNILVINDRNNGHILHQHRLCLVQKGGARLDVLCGIGSFDLCVVALAVIARYVGIEHVCGGAVCIGCQCVAVAGEGGREGCKVREAVG